MSSPSPIPPPNDRRSSRASSDASQPDANANLANAAVMAAQQASGFVVGGPPGSPSPLALRASHSRSSMRPRSRVAKIAPDVHLLDYVEPCDNNLVCLICHSAFDRPVRLACEHYFCRVCIDHALDAQPAQPKTCPTCRAKVDVDTDPLPVPRILETMLDELRVKCPNTKSGCSWVGQRANIHDHVIIYCEHSLVECPSYDCRLPVSQKDYHKGCLHYNVVCDACHVSLLKRDLEDHQRTACENRTTSCPTCDAELLRLDLKAHLKDTCPNVTVQCQGAIVGCTLTAQRQHLSEHEKACPMATMAPHFREQQARIERNEARFEPLARKVGIVEDGLLNITNVLYPANGNDQSFPVTNPLDPNDDADAFPPAPLSPTPDFHLPPASFAHVVPSLDQSQTPPSNAAQPPFDSHIHHVMAIIDSLREEVSRGANAINDIEGRTTMMIMTENQRLKEEMLHLNQSVQTLRMHLHWMTLQQRGSTGTASSAGSSTAKAGGGSTSASASDNNTSRTQGASASLGARPGVGATFPDMPVRRLSDSIRQVTKL